MLPFQLTINGELVSPVWAVAMVLMTLVNFGLAVFWIVVGWRAMKAHERLPDILRSTLQGPAAGAPPESGPPGRA